MRRKNWKVDKDGIVKAKCPYCKAITFVGDTEAHPRNQLIGSKVKCIRCNKLFDLRGKS